jgi:hypothetical protein
MSCSPDAAATALLNAAAPPGPDTCFWALRHAHTPPTHKQAPSQSTQAQEGLVKAHTHTYT